MQLKPSFQLWLLAYVSEKGESLYFVEFEVCGGKKKRKRKKNLFFRYTDIDFGMSPEEIQGTGHLFFAFCTG